MEPFTFDFLGLKAVAAAFVLIGGLWFYVRHIAGKTSADLLAGFKSDLANIEKIIALKAKEAEAKSVEVLRAQTTKTALEADIQKLRDFTDKVKQLF